MLHIASYCDEYFVVGNIFFFYFQTIHILSQKRPFIKMDITPIRMQLYKVDKTIFENLMKRALYRAQELYDSIQN